MANYSTNEFKSGLKILIDGDPYAIVENEMVKPGKGQAFNRVRVRNLKTGRTIERTWKSGDTVEAADVVDTDMQYLYRDGDFFNFMVPDTFEQLTASIAALRGNGVIGLYGVSKAADAGLARNLACEWGPQNVRVNAILPGLVKTDFARALWEDDANRKTREAQTPLRRIGKPDDIAGIAVMLAGPAGAFITGQTIVADGGVTIA